MNTFPIFSNVTYSKTIVKYHNQYIDINTIYLLCSDFPVISTLICACLCVCVSLCAFLCVSGYIQFYHPCRFMYPPLVPTLKGPLMLSFYNCISLPRLLNTISNPHPCSRQPPICPIFLKYLSFQNI